MVGVEPQQAGRLFEPGSHGNLIRHVLPVLGRRPVGSATRADLQALVDAWRPTYTPSDRANPTRPLCRQAGLPHNMAPHRLRHFLFTWLKTQGLDDALIQPYSGHTSRKSLEVCSRLSLAQAQPTYDETISRFPI